MPGLNSSLKNMHFYLSDESLLMMIFMALLKRTQNIK